MFSRKTTDLGIKILRQMNYMKISFGNKKKEEETTGRWQHNELLLDMITQHSTIFRAFFIVLLLPFVLIACLQNA